MSSRRILVIRPDKIGDVVLSLPVFEVIRRALPDAFLAGLVNPYTSPVLDNNPWIDEILTDDPSAAEGGMVGTLRQISLLRSRTFDTALMLLPTMRLAWMLLLAGIPNRIGVGHRIYQSLTWTKTVSRDKQRSMRHESDYCLDLVRAMDIAIDPCKPHVFLTSKEKAAAAALIVSKGLRSRPIIGLHPGNGNNAPNWSAKRYGELARLLFERYEVPLIVTGSAKEQPLAEEIIDASGIPIISLVGALSLRELMGVIGEMDLLVSSSTGPMHLAAALDVPTTSLFCPQPGRSPERWAPVSDKSCILLPRGGQCETCDVGPLCDLSDISTDVVFEGAIQLIDNRNLEK
ncbi:MAG: glycosyltransferase family 9 protein [Candidatus Latescibacteria bacterium]|nr:glycosyltransferase family 9 protein [Candidatus Latescibacterota bacterium]